MGEEGLRGGEVVGGEVGVEDGGEVEEMGELVR